MLIQFRVENHRSLRDEQTLSLVAASAGATDDRCLLHPEGIKEALLPAVALYGANASGKTNVLLALEYMARAVRDSHRLWEPDGGVPQDAFALSDRQHAPSLYEVEILIDGIRYRYGFTLDAKRIQEEWLYAWPNKKRQTWFERTKDAFTLGRHLGGENEVIRALTRSNSLYLSAGAQNNHQALLRIYGWFDRIRLEFRRPENYGIRETSLRSRAYWILSPWENFNNDPTRHREEPKSREEDRERIIQLLRSADTGIVEVRVDRAASDDMAISLPGQPRLYFQHKTADADRAWLPLEVESAGTVALLELSMRLVPVLRTGGVLCVDELESSLHPMLAGALLRVFCDPEQNPKGAQLIFTIHDTNLLGNMPGFSPLRRDQIWLTEKDQTGATHLYPLTDFHPRKHENLERGYLQGRYGAVPFLGDLLSDASLEQP